MRRQLRLVAVMVAAAHQQHEIGEEGEGSEEDRRTKIVAEDINITITIVIGTLTVVSWL